MRILDRIDYAQMSRDPKVLLGYSDLTALLEAFYKRSNVVVYHGPTIGAIVTDAVRDELRRALFSGIFGPFLTKEALAPGTATGVLRGGNLSLVAALCGTPYAIDFTDAIVLLEDIGEEPYRIDRLLTQLHLAGAFYAARRRAALTRIPPADRRRPGIRAHRRAARTAHRRARDSTR
jgi:muramoyltetrapeptide carboxypeptidase